MSGLLGHRGLLLTGGLWTPAQLIAPPAIWLDDFSAVTDASGFASQWNDRSGNGFHYTQATSSRRPQILSAEINGRRAIRFDGADDAMTCDVTGGKSLLISATSLWSFLVFKKRTTDGTAVQRIVDRFYISPASTGVFDVSAGMSTANAPTMRARRLNSEGLGSIQGSPTVGAWVMLFAQQVWSTGVGNFVIDGAAPVTGTLTTTGSLAASAAASSPTIGASTDASTTFSAYADVDLVAKINGINSVPSTDDVDRLFGWAAWRYGLQANLPPGHPYKSSPP